MDWSFITAMYIPIVVAACLVAGFVIKKWIRDVNNKWIPTICCLLGMILACISAKAFNLQTLVGGAVSGLASTGLHQAFKQLIKEKK